MDNNYGPVYYITSNVMNSKRYKDFRIRSLIESLIYVVIIFFGVSLIPFVIKVRIIVTVCLCVVAIAITLKGYKEQTPSELLLNMIQERKYMHDYHMRSINDDQGNEIFKESEFQNESYADKIIKKIKDYREKK